MYLVLSLVTSSGARSYLWKGQVQHSRSQPLNFPLSPPEEVKGPKSARSEGPTYRDSQGTKSRSHIQTTHQEHFVHDRCAEQGISKVHILSTDFILSCIVTVKIHCQVYTINFRLDNWSKSSSFSLIFQNIYCQSLVSFVFNPTPSNS